LHLVGHHLQLQSEDNVGRNHTKTKSTWKWIFWRKLVNRNFHRKKKKAAYKLRVEI